MSGGRRDARHGRTKGGGEPDERAGRARVNGQVPTALDDALARWGGTTSRRDFLKTSGTVRLRGERRGGGRGGPMGLWDGGMPGANRSEPASYPDPDFLQLDSWLVVHEDGTATFYVGKTDGGQGTGTATQQMMCDELDLAFDQATVVMGRTDMTVDQGGSGGSDAIERDAMVGRRIAAEARRVLLEMASERFGVPVEGLSVSEGVISLRDDPARTVTYGELIGGGRFDVALTGGNINATTGIASIKPVQDLKLVGQSIPRYDIPGKVDASLEWAVDVTLPEMVHARNVRPPFAGATLSAIDESSVRDLPGFIRLVSEGNYVAVVCEREEQAIEAAERLVVEWEKPATAPFPASDDLFDYMRSAERVPGSGGRGAAQAQGDPDGALASAATVVEAAYDIPFHGHTAIGPAHALADPSDGQMTIYTNDMKPYSHRTGIAEFLGMDPEQVRVIWMDGPQLYGRTAADDAGFEAAYLARELGRPVRVQWMRHEETAWDTKGPAFAIDLRGGLDADGNVVALDYRGRIANYAHVGYNQARTVLIAQLMGFRPERPSPGGATRPRRDVPHPEPAPGDAGGPLPAGLRDAAPHRQPARPQRPADDVRRGVVHRRAGRGRGCRPGGVPAASAARVDRRRRSLPPSTLDRSGRGRGGGVRVGRAPVTRDGGQRARADGAGHRVRVSRPHDDRRDRRGRGRPRDRPGVGPAHGVRPRLRPGDQPEQPREHHPGQPPARDQPDALRGGPLRRREGHQRRLAHPPDPHAHGHARADRRRDGERRPESGSAGPAALRGGGAVASAGAGGDCERDFRCDGGADEEVAVKAGKGVGGVGVAAE